MQTGGLAQKLVVVAVVGGLLVGAARLRGRHAEPTTTAAQVDDAPVTNGKSPRLLLSRLWFDELPKKRGDNVDLWLFLSGGIGLEERGSRWRFGLDFFEFERQGAKANLVWLADRKKQRVSFAVVECHDKPPFDLCLDLAEPLRGQKRLWSFDDDADMDANVPGGRDWRAALELRARSVR